MSTRIVGFIQILFSAFWTFFVGTEIFLTAGTVPENELVYIPDEVLQDDTHDFRQKLIDIGIDPEYFSMPVINPAEPRSLR